MSTDKRISTYEQCADSFSEAQHVCSDTLGYCLKRGKAYAYSQRIESLLDSALLCKMGENFLLRGSKKAHDVAELCIDSCQRSIESYKNLASDSQINACIEALQRCINACKSFISASDTMHAAI